MEGKFPCFNCKQFLAPIFYGNSREEYVNDPRLQNFGKKLNQVCGTCVAKTIEKRYCEKCFNFFDMVTE